MGPKAEGSGSLSGEERGDYFHFICGRCGVSMDLVYIGVAYGVGFSLSAECSACKKKYKGLKIKGFADKGLKPYIQSYYKDSEKISNKPAQGK